MVHPADVSGTARFSCHWGEAVMAAMGVPPWDVDMPSHRLSEAHCNLSGEGISDTSTVLTMPSRCALSTFGRPDLTVGSEHMGSEL